MPQINFTIPDSSPIITYSPAGAWGDSDAAQEKYTNGTFHFTQQPSASLEFKFNGTGVSLYGALRGNHNLYTVTVDGGHIFTGDGHAEGVNEAFNQTLFTIAGLADGLHTVKLANTPTGGGGYVDLDWATIMTGDGNAASPNSDVWVDDTHGNWTYDKAWTAGSGGLSAQYINETFYATNTNGAKATLDFFGNGIQLYGATSMNHGAYSVVLDGSAAQTYNGSAIAFRPQQLLYLASGLQTGMHRVVLQNVGTNYADVDYAIVSRYGVKGDAPPPVQSTTSSGTSSTVKGVNTNTAGNAGTTGGGTTPTTATAVSDRTSSGGLDPTSPSSGVSLRAHKSRAGAVALGAIVLCSVLLSAL